MILSHFHSSLTFKLQTINYFIIIFIYIYQMSVGKKVSLKEYLTKEE